MMVDANHLVPVLQALPQDTNIDPFPAKPTQFLSLLVACGDRSDRRQATSGKGTTSPAAKRIAGDGDYIKVAPSDAALRQAVLNGGLGDASWSARLQFVVLDGSLNGAVPNQSSGSVALGQR